MIDDIYTPEIKQYLESQPWPKKVQPDVRYIDDPAPHLFLVFYADNFETLTPQEQLQCVDIVKVVIPTLRKAGVPITFGKMESRNAPDA